MAGVDKYVQDLSKDLNGARKLVAKQLPTAIKQASNLLKDIPKAIQLFNDMSPEDQKKHKHYLNTLNRNKRDWKERLSILKQVHSLLKASGFYKDYTV